MGPKTATEDLAEARRIVLECLGTHPVRVYLFGSRARGEEGRASDIDIAILPLQPLPGWVISNVRERLEESRIPLRVDVVDLSTTDPEFRARVLEEGVPWNAPESAWGSQRLGRLLS